MSICDLASECRLRITAVLAAVCVALAAGVVRAQDDALRARIDDALVSAEPQGFVRHRWEHGPDLILLYFGAGWCAPCHKLTPRLIEVRDALRAAGASTEVVYVGLDESEREMRRHMRKQRMPWPAIDFRRLPSMPALRMLGGPAPPNLVLIDRENRVIANGWDKRKYVGVEHVLQAWLTSVQTQTTVTAHANDDSQPASAQPAKAAE